MDTDLEQWDQAVSDDATTLEAMDELIVLYRAARDHYDQCKAVASEANKQIDRLELRIIQTLNANKRSKYEVEGVAAVHITHKESYTTPKTLEAKHALFSYIQGKYGQDSLGGMLSINSQTLNAWANRESESGVMSIPGLEAPTATETLNLRRK